MNKIYKSVYVEHLGTWVAVSELSAAKGKRSGSVRGLASVLGGLSLIGVLGLLPGKATAIAIGETGLPATAGTTGVAIGASAVAAANAVALGPNTLASSNGALALGPSSNAGGDGAVAIGNLSNASMLRGVAIGARSSAPAANTALSSTSANTSTYASTTLGSVTYGGFAGSVGYHSKLTHLPP